MFPIRPSASMRLGTGRQDLENLGVAGQQPSNLFPTTTSTPRRHSIAVIKMNVSRAFVRAANTSATRVTIARRAAAQPAIRSYATPASSADTKPPVALYGLDGTYASALVRQFISIIPYHDTTGGHLNCPPACWPLMHVTMLTFTSHSTLLP